MYLLAGSFQSASEVRQKADDRQAAVFSLLLVHCGQRARLKRLVEMVRIKHRYITAQVMLPPTRSGQGSNYSLSQALFQSALRDKIRELYGEITMAFPTGSKGSTPQI